MFVAIRRASSRVAALRPHRIQASAINAIALPLREYSFFRLSDIYQPPSARTRQRSRQGLCCFVETSPGSDARTEEHTRARATSPARWRSPVWCTQVPAEAALTLFAPAHLRAHLVIAASRVRDVTYGSFKIAAMNYSGNN